MIKKFIVKVFLIFKVKIVEFNYFFQFYFKKKNLISINFNFIKKNIYLKINKKLKNFNKSSYLSRLTV